MGDYGEPFIVVWLLSCGVSHPGCLGFSGYFWGKFLIYYMGGRVGDLIQYLESYSFMFDMDYIERKKSAYF